jgi:hypothetical protein
VISIPANYPLLKPLIIHTNVCTLFKMISFPSGFTIQILAAERDFFIFTWTREAYHEFRQNMDGTWQGRGPRPADAQRAATRRGRGWLDPGPGTRDPGLRIPGLLPDSWKDSSRGRNARPSELKTGLGSIRVSSGWRASEDLPPAAYRKEVAGPPAGRMVSGPGGLELSINRAPPLARVTSPPILSWSSSSRECTALRQFNSTRTFHGKSTRICCNGLLSFSLFALARPWKYCQIGNRRVGASKAKVEYLS